MTVLFVALVGGLGAVARFVIDGFIKNRVRDGFPWGTLTINLTGSLLLGFLVGLGFGALPEQLTHILGAGFLGGYTTFSTACFETAVLAQKREWGGAFFNALGMLVASVLLAAFGLWLGVVV